MGQNLIKNRFSHQAATDGQSDTKNETKDSDDLNPTEEHALTETAVTTNQVPTPGHGRLPHSAYTKLAGYQAPIHI